MISIRRSSPIIIIFALLIFLPRAVNVCSAQGVRPGRLIPEKSIGTATASYFPKENHTTVQIRPLQVTGHLQNGVILIPSFIVPGKEVIAPKRINLQFIVDTPTDVQSSLKMIQIFVDGKELISGVPVLVSASKSADSSVTKILMYKVPYAKFVQILKGELVKMNVGEIEFELSEEHLVAMRDLQKMVVERVAFP